MKVFNDFLKIKMANIVLGGLMLLMLGIAIYYYFCCEGTKTEALLGSLCAGLFVAIIQFIISYHDYTRNEIFRKLHIIGIFDNRNKKEEYRDYIATASHEIKIMGSTAVRFFRDFCVTDASAPDEEKIVITKLSQGVCIMILLPSKQFLSNEKLNDYDFVKKKIAEIKNIYPKADFYVRYFEHTANHSIFMVDDSCIVGPIFPNLESKYTFSQQLNNTSELAKNYLRYFDEEWENAHE